MSADEIRKTGCPGRVCFTKDGTVVTRTPPSDSSAFLRLLLWEYSTILMVQLWIRQHIAGSILPAALL
jgi:hypothetical protein